MLKILKPAIAVSSVFLFMALPHQALSQLENRPYSFNNGNQGVGISLGGRQAILNEKILGQAPNNLVRGPSGELLDVTRGPGRSAIISYQGNGGFIPNYKGTSFTGRNNDMAAGVFNSFFSNYNAGGSYAPYAHIQTRDIVNEWTVNLVAGGQMHYMPQSPVSAWTGMVHGLE